MRIGVRLNVAFVGEKICTKCLRKCETVRNMCGIAVTPLYDHLNPDQYRGVHKWHCLQIRDSMVVQVWVGILSQKDE